MNVNGNKKETDWWKVYADYAWPVSIGAAISVLAEPVIKESVKWIQAGIIVLYVSWAWLLYKAAQVPQSIGGRFLTRPFLIILTGITAVIGFLYAFLVYVLSVVLELDRYEENGFFEKLLIDFKERKDKMTTPLLDYLTAVITEPIDLYVEGLRAKQQLLRTLRYSMYAALLFSTVALLIVMRFWNLV